MSGHVKNVTEDIILKNFEVKAGRKGRKKENRSTIIHERANVSFIEVNHDTWVYVRCEAIKTADDVETFSGFRLDACNVVCELKVAVYKYAEVAVDRCIWYDMGFSSVVLGDYVSEVGFAFVEE